MTVVDQSIDQGGGHRLVEEDGHPAVETHQDRLHNKLNRIFEALYRDGGCVAQCEFRVGGHPENVRALFEAWDGS